MKTNLREIAKVFTGYQFRNGVPVEPHGSYRVLQTRDINNDGSIDIEKTARVELSELKPSQLLRSGDLVIPAKGNRHVTAEVTDAVGPAVASGSLFVIRPDRSIVEPGYLAWRLNQPDAKQYLDQHTTGATVPMITRQIVEQVLETQMTLPPLQVQRQIVRLIELQRSEWDLKQRLVSLQETRLRAVVFSLVAKTTLEQPQ